MYKLRLVVYQIVKSIRARYNPEEKTNSHVVIGENSIVKNTSFGRYNSIGPGSFLLNVQYGDFTYNAQRGTFVNCKIGKFCSIGQNVGIGLGKHPSDKFVSTHPVFYSTLKQCGISFADRQYFDETGFVEVGNDVWIGADSIILDNIKIGNGAIIAANSVVANDVPPYAIVGGTPAKIIKYRFLDVEIEYLNNSEWWEKDIEWLHENYKLFHDVNFFMGNDK